MDNGDGADDFGEDHGHFNSVAAGTAYALYRHGQDQQTTQLANALQRPVNVQVHLDGEDPKGIAPVNALDFATAVMPKTWDDYIGQEPLKRQLSMHIKATQQLGQALPHVLLASGRAGVGKTTMARLIAKTMRADIIEMVPPFNIWTLSEAAQRLYDHDVLFIDEALSVDTPIPTPTGWTTMGDLKSGDLVFGSDGRPVHVLNATEIAENRPCYRVDVGDGEAIVADANHKWLVSVNSGAPKVLTTSEIFERKNRGHKLQVRRHKALDLPDLPLPLDPYTLGLWLGNGDSSAANLGIRMSDIDQVFPWILANERAHLTGPYSTGALMRVSVGRAHGLKLQRPWLPFRTRLIESGLLGNKHIPEAYLRASAAQRLALLQGLMDTDGHVGAGGYCEYVTTSAELADGVLELVRSLGYRASIGRREDHRRVSYQDTFKIYFMGSIEMPPARVSRHVSRLRVPKRTMFGILSIEPVDSVPVRCIQVDADDHLFLAGRTMLPTHNCHILANHGKRGAEILLKVLEDKTLYLPDGDVIRLNDITIIGATTDPDKLPETILDRFKIKPYFQAYSLSELGLIAVEFAFRHDCLDYVSPKMAVTFAQACRGTPRVLEEMVLACRTLVLSLGTVPTPEQVLEFLEVEPDGLTRTHVHYLTAMFQYFKRETNAGGIEYIAGEATMQQILRETKPGIGRVERYLVEQGLLDRTPRGRRLSDRGIDRALEFIASGKGAADIG